MLFPNTHRTISTKNFGSRLNVSLAFQIYSQSFYIHLTNVCSVHVELQASLGRFRFFKKLLALIHCCWTKEPLSNMYRTFLMSERSSLNFGWFRISGFGAQQSLHVGCSQQRQARAKFKSRSNSTSLL